jgi:hypothetical protein
MMVLGLWMMIAPDVFQYSKNIANSAHIAGPLIATFSIIAIWECTRNVRLLNLPVAAWMLMAPLFIPYDSDSALMHDYGVAIIIIFLLLVNPSRKHRFGGGWPSVLRSDTAHARAAGNALSRRTPRL